MKKIGTITFHESINYGAILQTYALQKYLVNNEYNSEVINYVNAERGISNLSYSKKLIHYLWDRVVKHMIIGEKRKRKSVKFINNNIPISEKIYTSFDSLHQDPPNYDVFITGSDQVWNPKNTSGDSSYFLTFAPEDKLKLSYAPSFGVSIINEIYQEKYKNWLSRIDILSVRENEGKSIVKELIGKDIPITLDPTMLLEREDWEKVAVSYDNEKPYVLCYHMPGDKIVNKSISKIANKIAKKNNWDVISIGQKEYMKLIPGKKRIFDAGPDEYIGLFQNASFVLTNSFHGTVFAILFNKSFYVPINSSLPKNKVLSSRISSLLSILRIDNRLISANKNFNIDHISYVDYTNVNYLLKKAREESQLFLKKALE